MGHKDDTDLVKLAQDELTINGNLVVTGSISQAGGVTGEGNFTNLTVDDVVVNGNQIGHKDNTDLIILSSDLINITTDIKLATSKSYQIGTENVLTETTLGTSIINSSLQSVGVLDAGSITANFGEINIGSSPMTTTGQGTFGILEIDQLVLNDNQIGLKTDTDLLTLSDQLMTVNGIIKLATSKIIINKWN